MKTGPFTEGTDLFSKGLVYSRRIGGRPLYTTAKTTEIIIDNFKCRPNQCIKSIRTNKTDWGRDPQRSNKKTFATIETETHKKQGEEVEPLSNYNVLVLDQRFRKTQLFPLSTLMLLETVVFATETSLL
jgi:hypothetical protein